MSFEHWLAFALASAILLAIPGPTVLLVVSYALSHGRRAARATVAGVALGDLTAMAASMLGVGALLAASATLFTVVKWIGAAYLIYLGIRLWRAPVTASMDVPDAPAACPARIAFHAFAVTALNPKSIVFFVAFLPQFLDPRGDVAFQMAIFSATFLALAVLNAGLYALAASRARVAIRRPSLRRAVNRAGGSVMIAAGLGAALWRRAPS